MVDRAVAALIEREGRKAFREFSGDDWHQDDRYLFVLNMRKKILAHPVRPDIGGKTLGESEYELGRNLGDDIVKALEGQDSAWIEYRWPWLGTGEVVVKRSYIRTATSSNGEREFIVGAGHYTE